MAQSLTKDITLVVKLIAALDSKFGIAKNGKIPWPRLAMDMDYLHSKTSQPDHPDKKNAIIFGRVTFEAIPPHVINKHWGNCYKIVLSRSRTVISGADSVCGSFEEAMQLITAISHKIESIWNMGGSSVYKVALDSGFKLLLYITHIEGDYECDRFFPVDININEWVELEDSAVPTKLKMTENGVEFQFKVYERINIKFN